MHDAAHAANRGFAGRRHRVGTDPTCGIEWSPTYTQSRY
jgi:hypothetical protein